MNKKIYLFAICCMFGANAYAIDYSNDNWRFALNADGMAGFLETKDDKLWAYMIGLLKPV